MPRRLPRLALAVLLIAGCGQQLGRGQAAAASAAAAEPVAHAAPTDLAKAAWPQDESGLLFCFRSVRDMIAFDADGTRKQVYGVNRFGLQALGFVWSDPDGALVLLRGRYVTQDATAFLQPALAGAAAFSLEVFANPGGSGGLIAGLSGPGGLVCALVEDGTGLVLRCGGVDPRSFPLGRVGSGPVHALISIGSGQAQVFLDGKPLPALAIPAPVFAEGVRIVLGGDHDGVLPWRGTVHQVALFARSGDATQAAEGTARLRARLAGRPALPTSAVECELVQTASIPAPQRLAPYFRALAACTYRVVRVLDGPPISAPIIKVAHWSVMNGARLGIRGQRVGSRQVFRLVDFARRPDLGSEFISESPGDEDAPIYFDDSAWSVTSYLAAQDAAGTAEP